MDSSVCYLLGHGGVMSTRPDQSISPVVTASFVPTPGRTGSARVTDMTKSRDEKKRKNELPTNRKSKHETPQKRTRDEKKMGETGVQTSEYRKGDISKLLNVTETGDESRSALQNLFCVPSVCPEMKKRGPSMESDVTLTQQLPTQQVPTQQLPTQQVATQQLPTPQPQPQSPTSTEGDEMRRRLTEGLKRAREVEEEHLRSKGLLNSGPRKKARVEGAGVETTEPVDQSKNRRGRRELNDDEKKEENRRTVFIGNIPLEINESQLSKLLELVPSQIQSVRD